MARISESREQFSLWAFAATKMVVVRRLPCRNFALRYLKASKEVGMTITSKQWGSIVRGFGTRCTSGGTLERSFA